jgi:hypothetical protein
MEAPPHPRALADVLVEGVTEVLIAKHVAGLLLEDSNVEHVVIAWVCGRAGSVNQIFVSERSGYFQRGFPFNPSNSRLPVSLKIPVNTACTMVSVPSPLSVTFKSLLLRSLEAKVNILSFAKARR